jgi:hypothetical protein
MRTARGHLYGFSFGLLQAQDAFIERRLDRRGGGGEAIMVD